MNFYKAIAKKDFEYIANLYNPNNNQYLAVKKVSAQAIEHSPANHHQYIISHEDRMIGFFAIVQNRKDGTKGHFVMIIDQPHQAQGYGQKTIDIIIQEAKALGIKELSLGVFSKHSHAQYLYAKFGFKESHEILYMTKNI